VDAGSKIGQGDFLVPTPPPYIPTALLQVDHNHVTRQHRALADHPWMNILMELTEMETAMLEVGRARAVLKVVSC
jgi:hypothetical protein